MPVCQITKMALHSFLMICLFYRLSVKIFGQIASTLPELGVGGAAYVWNEKANASDEELERGLISFPY